EGKAALPLLIEMLSDKDEWFARTAAIQLENMGPAAKPAVPALLLILKDFGRANLQEAASALGKIAPGEKTVVAALISLMSPRNGIEIRHTGVMGIAQMGEAGKEGSTAIIAVLQVKGDTDSLGDGPQLAISITSARLTAALVLGKMGKSAPKEAVPALIQVMLDEKS